MIFTLIQFYYNKNFLTSYLCRLWGLPTEGVDCGDEVARWLSRYILNEDEGLRMLYNANENMPAKPLHKDLVTASKVLEADLKNVDSVCFDFKYGFLMARMKILIICFAHNSKSINK